MRDRVHLDHLAIGTGAVILGEFAEWSLRLAHTGQDSSFDYDFRVRGNAHRIGPAFHDVHRHAEQRTGNRHFVLIQRGDRLRGKQQGRMSADDDRDFQRLPLFFRDAIVGERVARKQQDADTVRAANLAAVDRDVLDAGLGIAGDQQSGRDIGPAVALIVLGNWKLAE